MANLRITVTLESDVAEQIKALARRRNISFETALNSALRDGLAAGRSDRTPYLIACRPMGLRTGIDLTHALHLAGELEDEEIVRKRDLQK